MTPVHYPCQLSSGI